MRHTSLNKEADLHGKQSEWPVETNDLERVGREVNEASESGETFFAYRLPESETVFLGRDAASIDEIVIPNSFNIYSFDGSFYTSLVKKVEKAKDNGGHEDSTKIKTAGKFPHSNSDTLPESTLKTTHEKNVRTIVKELNEAGGGKCVLSRVKTGLCLRSPGENFVELCRKKRSAFVFCYFTPQSGLWIGATPETLLRGHDGKLFTMALAGTRKSGSSGKWDAKNIEEQQIVTHFIADKLAENGLKPIISPLFTKNAGPVEHLCQHIEAQLPDDDHSSEMAIASVASLLKSLSPTPALGGYPRENALRLISSLEDHDRGCYGGFCGLFHNVSDFNLFVNLRSARLIPISDGISGNRWMYVKYCGGGITRFSNPEDEWIETEMKSTSLDL